MDSKLHYLLPCVQALVSVSEIVRFLNASLLNNCHDVCVLLLHLLDVVGRAIAFCIAVSPSFDLAHVSNPLIRKSIKRDTS